LVALHKITNDTIITPHPNNPSCPINPTYILQKPRARVRACIYYGVCISTNALRHTTARKRQVMPTNTFSEFLQCKYSIAAAGKIS